MRYLVSKLAIPKSLKVEDASSPLQRSAPPLLPEASATRHTWPGSFNAVIVVEAQAAVRIEPLQDTVGGTVVGISDISDATNWTRIRPSLRRFLLGGRHASPSSNSSVLIHPLIIHRKPDCFDRQRSP